MIYIVILGFIIFSIICLLLYKHYDNILLKFGCVILGFIFIILIILGFIKPFPYNSEKVNETDTTEVYRCYDALYNNYYDTIVSKPVKSYGFIINRKKENSTFVIPDRQKAYVTIKLENGKEVIIDDAYVFNTTKDTVVFEEVFFPSHYIKVTPLEEYNIN